MISKEDFMKDVKAVNSLKLKINYGHLGYAGNTGHFLYRTNWKNGDKFEHKPSTGGPTTDLVRYGNPDLKWEYSNELNIGVEGTFFNNRLSADVNYFREMRKNIIGKNTVKYAAVVGDFIPAENIGEVMNQGIDAQVRWQDKIGEIHYNVGVNLTFTKNKLRKSDELDNIEDYRKSVGRSTSTIFGLQAEGLFGKDVQLAGHPLQSYGAYQAGDIAYADLNGDNMINDNDVTDLGQSFPLPRWVLIFR